MGVAVSLLALQRIHDDDVAWKLLRANSSPLILAILGQHLGKDTPRRPASEMQALVTEDLAEIRMRLPEVEIRLSPRAYLEKWRNNGYLICRASEKSRQETYELSPGALKALAFVGELEHPHQSATRSRLSLILDQVAGLSLSVDSDVERRRHALLNERSRIDAEIKALESGVLEVGDHEQALEQIREIINLSREVPRDFINVAADFERISKELFRSLILDDAESRDILENVFAGVDQIGQSPSGRTFKGFYELLRDVEASERFQDDVEVILDAEFATAIDPEDRRFLRRFIQSSLSNSREVHETLTSLARGLRRFVQSQSFQQERRIKRSIDQALARANELSDVIPLSTAMESTLEMTSTLIAPITRLSLNDLSERVSDPILLGEKDQPEELSLEELRRLVREVEIDFKELASNVNAVLKEATTAKTEQRAKDFHTMESGITVRDVLDAFPATQGLASIVGLMALAQEQGVRRNGTEIVQWMSREGRERKAVIDEMAFIKEIML